MGFERIGWICSLFVVAAMSAAIGLFGTSLLSRDKPVSIGSPAVHCSHSMSSPACSNEIAARSADAATSAAWWAQFQTLIGVIGFVAVMYNLVLTSRSTKSVANQVEVAEQTAKQQLRAYVHVRRIVFSDFMKFKPVVAIYAFNDGATPAKNIEVDFRIYLVEGGKNIEHGLLLRHGSEKNGAPIAKDGFFNMPFQWHPPAWDSEHASRELNRHQKSLSRGQTALHFVGWLKYEDIFGETHSTNFHVFIGGAWGAVLGDMMAQHGLIEEKGVYAPALWPGGDNSMD